MSPRLALISLYDHHAFGIRGLYSILRKNNVDTFCIFYKYFTFKMEQSSDKELDILVKLLKDLSVDIVGISVLSTFYKEAARLTKRIKNDLDIPIIWGGVHPTVKPQECIELADFVFRGEAEETLLEFVKNWNRNRNLDIPGLWSKKGNEIKKGSPPQLINDLNNLPMPDFSEANKYYIEDDGLLYGDPVYKPENFTGLYKRNYRALSSRGCPFNCSYCSNHIFKKLYKSGDTFIRKRNVTSLIEELKNAKQHLKAISILFNDECFATDIEWISDFCRAYKEEVCLPFYCEMHPSILNEELISMLKSAGLSATCIGIQAGSERIRNECFNRPVSDEMILDKARLLKKYKVGIHYEIITDNPYEKEADKLKTVELLLKLPQPVRLNVFSLNFLPETEITERALFDGMILKNDIEGDSTRGMRQFILKKPSDGKDKFWNYIYFLASDYFCSSGNTLGLRHLFSNDFILFLTKLKFIRRCPWIFTKSIDLLNEAIIIKWKASGWIKKYRIAFPKKPILFLKILVASSLIPLIINFVEPKKLLKLLIPHKNKNVDDERLTKIIKYTNFIMSLKPWRNIKNCCLLRSMILFYFLRREGLDVRINFGARKENDTLQGHCWLTLNRNIYPKNSPLCQDFEIIHSFPA